MSSELRGEREVYRRRRGRYVRAEEGRGRLMENNAEGVETSGRRTEMKGESH